MSGSGTSPIKGADRTTASDVAKRIVVGVVSDPDFTHYEFSFHLKAVFKKNTKVNL